MNAIVRSDDPVARIAPKPRRPDYPLHWEKWKVMCNGLLRWHSHDVFLSETFGGHTVALEPIDSHLWRVRFHEFTVGTFDERTKKISSYYAQSGKDQPGQEWKESARPYNSCA